MSKMRKPIITANSIDEEINQIIGGARSPKPTMNFVPLQNADSNRRNFSATRSDNGNF